MPVQTDYSSGCPDESLAPTIRRQYGLVWSIEAQVSQNQ